ncbi:MAG TPA: YfhO family protein [Actinomycetota bacterium]
MSWRRIAVAWAGPVLIVAVVVFALRGFLFEGHLTDEHPDLLAFWLPRWSFLGRSLRELQLPLWNPYEMTGYRFAADPQSGWLAAAPSLLFSLLSPGPAMRGMIALQPILAGVGMFAFLRVDGIGRLAATAGGLSLAGAMAISEIAIAMPFAGTLAWTTVLLLGAAGFLRAERWSRRIAWVALAGFAWSQVAGAHLSHGLVMATVLTVAYLVARAWGRGGGTAGRVALFLVIVPLCALAVLVPRLRFIQSSSLGEGYDRLGAQVHDLAAGQEEPLTPGGVWAGWPIAFGAAPGAYLGAVTLLAVPLALRARRRRRLVVAFGGVLAVTWVVLSDVVLGVGWVRDAVLTTPYGDVLLHNPGRLRYVGVLALPVLAAAGIQGLRDEPMPAHRLAAWLAAGAALWLGVPIVAGGALVRWGLFAIAVLPAALALWLSTRTRWWTVMAVGLLAVELTAGAVLASRVSGDEIRVGLEGSGGTPLAFQPLRAPAVDPAAFLAPTTLVGRIGEDRYLTWAPPDAAYEKGYLFAQGPTDWPALANERGTLFGVRDALGYNPVQLPRYWAWIRTTNPLPLYYNAAALARPTPADLRTLGVRYLVVPEGVTPTVPGHVVATADGYDLVEVAGWEPLATLRPDWLVVEDVASALARIPDAAAEGTTIVEGDPGIAPTDHLPGTVDVISTSDRGLTARVDAGSDQLLVIRTAYDAGWRATVDGRDAPVLPADAISLAIPVPSGEHTVILRYDDPDVLLGLALSAIVWTALAGAFAGALVRERERARSSEPPPGADARRPAPGRTAARPGTAGSGTPS